MALNDTPQKSFWSRPEGTTGMLAIGGGLVGLYFALPTLIAFMAGMAALLGHTIAVVALCAVLAAMLFVLTNSKFLTLCKYMFKSAMRKVTGLFVEIDPIGIMKSYIEDLVKKREGMAGSRDKLKGQIGVLKKKIDGNTIGYDRAMSMASLAKDKGNTGVLAVQSRQAGRLERLNKESFGPLLAQMEVHLRALDKYYEVTGTVIDDLGNEVEARKMEREMIMASYSAMSAAKKILMGGTDEKELFDQAMEFVVNDFGMKMGEIDSFIENSKGFVEGLDMQNGVYEADALKKLQAWEAKADSILLGNGKAQLLENTLNMSTINLGIGVPAAQIVDYDSLIARK
jgi:hypothetical protein